jgi:hypothetical protein
VGSRAAVRNREKQRETKKNKEKQGKMGQVVLGFVANL